MLKIKKAIECVQTLLELNCPVLIRNDSGKTPRDVGDKRVVACLDSYMSENQGKIYTHYDALQTLAKKKYPHAEPITRVFVVGNTGVGKSSFIEALKRESLWDSFTRVSKSSVPPHTAGIVPSIHTRKYYGKVLFYDFAGDAEYYSSGGAPQGGQGGRPPPQLEHWGGIAPPTLGYNTQGYLRVQYCLYSVTVYTG